jgi:ribosomal protein L6P/L9E
MKTIQANKVITVPDRVNVSLRGRVIKVTGPRGTLEKDFGHASLEMIKLRGVLRMLSLVTVWKCLERNEDYPGK